MRLGIPLALVGLVAVLVPIHALYGIDADASDLLGSLVSPDPDRPAQMLLHHLRLPRTLAAICVGAGLALAGTLFQAATRNPLASPGILGVTAGAQLFVAIASILPVIGGLLPPGLAAFAGGLAAFAVTWMVSGSSRAGPIRLALSGTAVSLMAGAGASALALLDETAGAGFYLWGGGSLVQSGWTAPLGALAALLPLLAASLILARSFDIMALGNDIARTLGQNLVLVRAGALLIGVLASALAVTLAGPVVFVGLVAPNLLRRLGVDRHAALLPLAALAGVALVVAADLVVLALTNTLFELPVGVPTAIVGAPFLIVLARRLARQPSEARREFAPSGRLISSHRRLPAIWLILPLALVVPLALMAGNRWIGPAEIATLWSSGDSSLAHVLELRALRVAGSGLAGALLALSGLLLQGVVRNPLASPDLLGITQGAGLLAVTAIVLLPGAGVGTVQAASLAGGLGAALFVALLGLRRDLAPSALALMALGLAALSASLTSLVVIGAGFQASSAATWLAGSTYGAEPGGVILLLACFTVMAPPAFFLLAEADLLAFGRDKAATLGLSVRQSELALLVLGALAASVVAAVFGPIAFIGLMAPHAARLVRPGSFRQIMAPALAIGAAAMIVADLLGRSLVAPIEIPTGLMAALLGAPFILLVLRRA